MGVRDPRAVRKPNMIDGDGPLLLLRCVENILETSDTSTVHNKVQWREINEINEVLHKYNVFVLELLIDNRHMHFECERENACILNAKTVIMNLVSYFI